jgi:hypothetical protein
MGYPKGSLYEKIEKIIGPKIEKQQRATVRDSHTPDALSMADIEDIRGMTLDHVRGEYTKDSGAYQSLDEARRETGDRVKSMFAQAMAKDAYVKDGFMNDVTGIGTAIDPAMYNTAYVPLSLSPDEATGIYASGGIPAKIIDKKSEGVLLNGYSFDGLEKGDSDGLHDYAEGIGFSAAVNEALRDGNIYGGALLVPALAIENSLTYLKTFEELVKDGALKKGSLRRFWTADRWNAVLVPDFNLSAESFVNPKSFFVPMAGIDIKTSRMAVIRPKKLPFWGIIRQVGWGISDIEGWMRSVLAYEMGIMAIPTMAQQISLMYHHIPLDGVLVQNGAEYAKAFAQGNAELMREWSILNPRTMNSLGEIKILDRTYTGYWDLVKILQEDVGAKSEISNNILFHQNPTGFSENEKDITMMQSEVTKRIANVVAPQLKNVVKMLAVSYFGPDADQCKNLDAIKINFNPPQMITNQERQEQGRAFAEILTRFVSEIGMPAKEALAMACACIPTIEVPDEVTQAMENLDSAGEGEPPQGNGLLKGLIGGQA